MESIDGRSSGGVRGGPRGYGRVSQSNAGLRRRARSRNWAAVSWHPAVQSNSRGWSLSQPTAAVRPQPGQSSQVIRSLMRFLTLATDCRGCCRAGSLRFRPWALRRPAYPRPKRTTRTTTRDANGHVRHGQPAGPSGTSRVTPTVRAASKGNAGSNHRGSVRGRQVARPRIWSSHGLAVVLHTSEAACSRPSGSVTRSSP